MSEPFLSEVRIVGFNFAPRGWAFCDGQILSISQNQSLYSLLGTTYGGDGRTSFALPDMRGRAPIHTGSSNGTSYKEGQKGGEEQHTLAVNEMPRHTHALNASNADADTPVPSTDAALANVLSQLYTPVSQLAAMQDGTIANTGGGQGHDNMQPYLAVNFCIALQGLYPSRN